MLGSNRGFSGCSGRGVGVPLVTALMASYRLLRRSTRLLAAAGAAVFATVTTVTVVQMFDPHVTLRGTVDVFYPLLALAAAGWAGRR